MTSAQKAEIRDALLHCAVLLDPAERRAIFVRLPFFAEIPDDNVFSYHVQKAVDVAERRPWGLEILMDAVLWGEGLTAQFLGVCDLLQAARFWGVEWKLAFEIRSILKSVDLDASRIASAYRKALPNEAIPEADDYTELLPLCVYDLANRTNSQLHTFVTDLLPYLGEKREAVKEWLNKALLSAPRNLPAAPTVFASAPVLVIKVEKDVNTADFHVTAWYSRPQPTPLRGLETPFSRAALEDAFAICWKETRRLMEGDTVAQQQLGVEVFLPLDLLADKTLRLDRLELKYGLRSKSLVGADASVVVRSWDRAYNPELRQYAWGAWDNKWRARPLPPRPFKLTDLYWVCSDPELHGDHYATLRQNPLVFISLAEVPPGNAGIDIVAQLIDAGTPIALWLREGSPEAEAHRSQLCGLLCENHSDELPRLVLKKRRAWPQDSLWQHVVLLWDDPTHLPPDLTN